MAAADLALWLFVINLGIVFGAGLYEARIVVPMWAASPPESLQTPDSGRQFWAFVSTLPLTLLTLAGLALSWHPHGDRQHWWHLAAVIILVERISTFAYFIPTMIRLQRATEGATIAARLALWSRLNYVRNALALIGWIAALTALTTPK